jgi:hypothetical protein
MYSDAYPDYLRMTALNLPAALLVLGFLFSLDDLTGAQQNTRHSHTVWDQLVLCAGLGLEE